MQRLFAQLAVFSLLVAISATPVFAQGGQGKGGGNGQGNGICERKRDGSGPGCQRGDCPRKDCPRQDCPQDCPKGDCPNQQAPKR